MVVSCETACLSISRVALSTVWLRQHGPLIGVGHHPQALSCVGGSDVSSGKHSPSSIKPHRGKVSKDSLKSSNKEGWRVFHEHESRSNFINHARHFSPKSTAFAIKSSSFPGCAQVLAGEPARHHVNNSFPRSSVKCSNVIPDRERAKNSIVLALAQNPNGVGLPFNSANGSPPEQLAAEYSATSPGEEGEFA